MTRFPEDTTEEELWQHFKKVGDVREVFISKRRNRNSRKYGFVRFKSVEDVYELERKLDNIVLGGLRMYVNIPKYGKERSGMTLSTARGKQYVKQYEDENRGTYPSTKQPVPSGLNRGSFADAVVGRNSRVDQRKPPTNEDYLCHSLRSSVQLDIPLSGQKWLHEAWVGRLKNLALFDRVEEDILWDLGVNISLKYIGGDMILLLGLTKEQARQMMDAKNEGGDSLFHTLEKWSPQMRSGYRLTWVQC